MAIADQLTLLNATKTAIKDAIEAKGSTVGTIPFGDYPSKIAAITSGPVVTPAYVRPADWMTLPTVTNTENKFVGLMAVTDDPNNFVALKFTAVGGFTVNWGDGVVETFASAATALHQYTYSNASLGPITTRGYKQAIVTVTATTGTAFTVVDMSVKHTNVSTGAVVQWLDVVVSAPLMTSFVMGSGPAALPLMMESIALLSGTVTGTFLFTACVGLKQALIYATIITGTSFMFSGCALLAVVSPLTLWTAAGANRVLTTSYMFNGCRALIAAPEMDLQYITTTDAMFQNCQSLVTVPNYNFTSLTGATSMFSSCFALLAGPVTSFPALLNGSSMFNACNSLISIPEYSFPVATNLSSMFNACVSLVKVKITTSVNLINTQSMFTGCAALLQVDTFNTAAVTSMFNMFSGCTLLKVIPPLNLQSCTNFQSWVFNCKALTTINTGNMTNQTPVMTSTFQSCPSLSKILMTNFNGSFSVAGCSLSAASLNQIYNNLNGSANGTITVTGNYGTATDTPSIATSRGWAVVG